MKSVFYTDSTTNLGYVVSDSDIGYVCWGCNDVNVSGGTQTVMHTELRIQLIFLMIVIHVIVHPMLLNYVVILVLMVMMIGFYQVKMNC